MICQTITVLSYVLIGSIPISIVSVERPFHCKLYSCLSVRQLSVHFLSVHFNCRSVSYYPSSSSSHFRLLSLVEFERLFFLTSGSPIYIRRRRLTLHLKSLFFLPPFFSQDDTDRSGLLVTLNPIPHHFPTEVQRLDPLTDILGISIGGKLRSEEVH